ncbi:mycothiol system anti-sigma-R factor [Algoriphagus faecimaris]|uniref:Mycothiol system anti-sigma-R factor n=2 Tax=Algoriphagus faecimaris TaxID=686796 RepID=A0A1G6XME2_9BACT|nr:mycothiol system anti-sigma-R factor [Algoriphagus faecimaris]
MPSTWATIRTRRNKNDYQMDKKEESTGERKLQCSDVSKCFELLESILDGEMGDPGKEMMKEKLAKCQPCFEHFHLEQAIRELLKTKCSKQAVPGELVDSIRTKISDIK